MESKHIKALYDATEYVLYCLKNEIPMGDTYTCNEVVARACMLLGFDYRLGDYNQQLSVGLHEYIDEKGNEYKDMHYIDRWYSAFIERIARNHPEKSYVELRIEWITWLRNEIAKELK